MPSVSADNRAFYKSKIRSLLVQNPQITQREIKERLEKDGLTLDRKYLGKLLNGIYIERTRRVDTITLNIALSAFAETMEEIVKKAWEVVNDPFIRLKDPKAAVMALKEIRESHNAVFEKLFDAGVFNRKLGEIDLTVRNAPLPEERKKAIRKVFEQWGLVESREPHKELPPPNGSVSTSAETPA